jgi:hypothetical protein
MEKQKTTEHTILCECGHPLSSHSLWSKRCNTSTRKTERRKNHLGKYISVKCCYVCYCEEFKLLTEKSQVDIDALGMDAPKKYNPKLNSESSQPKT